MNNEPVAWIVDGKIVYPAKTLTDEEYDNIFANGKRLGVIETEDRFRNAMNLTDEEIIKEALDIGFLTNEDLTPEWAEYTQEFIASVRAILRKAQEK